VRIKFSHEEQNLISKQNVKFQFRAFVLFQNKIRKPGEIDSSILMKNLIVLILPYILISKLSAQINAGLNINYCHPISKTPSRFGYTVFIGYSIKKKFDINIKTENSIIMGYIINKDFRMNSYQLELKYYVTGINFFMNPYCSVGAGYFIRPSVGNTDETAMGILPSIGALVKLQESKKSLYLNTQLAYCYVNTPYPTTTVNFNIGVLYYFKSKSETQKMQRMPQK
jgi:hypothetical protein